MSSLSRSEALLLLIISLVFLSRDITRKLHGDATLKDRRKKTVSIIASADTQYPPAIHT